MPSPRHGRWPTPPGPGPSSCTAATTRRAPSTRPPPTSRSRPTCSRAAFRGWTGASCQRSSTCGCPTPPWNGSAASERSLARLRPEQDLACYLQLVGHLRQPSRCGDGRDAIVGLANGEGAGHLEDPGLIGPLDLGLEPDPLLLAVQGEGAFQLVAP